MIKQIIGIPNPAELTFPNVLAILNKSALERGLEFRISHPDENIAWKYNDAAPQKPEANVEINNDLSKFFLSIPCKSKLLLIEDSIKIIGKDNLKIPIRISL